MTVQRAPLAKKCGEWVTHDGPRAKLRITLTHVRVDRTAVVSFPQVSLKRSQGQSRSQQFGCIPSNFYNDKR